MARNDPQLVVRLPEDAKAYIEAEARRNASSQTSEVVRAIRERMQRQAQTTSESRNAAAGASPTTA